MHLSLFFLSVRLGIVIVHSLSDTISGNYPALKQKEYKLTAADKSCLSVNMISETIFTYWIYCYDLPAISFFCPLNIFLLLLFDDLLYAPYHHLLHIKPIFKYVHFRHHFISHPSKSYIHASMEHPLEMIGALLLHAIVIINLTPVLDKVSVILHLFIKALGACLNHSGRDVECAFYCTKYHHLHHMRRTCNYSQYLFSYDRMMGTLQS